MIELKGDELVVSLPEVHEDAVCRIGFQRTLRIPDDNREYPLPAGLGPFPLHHVDDFASTVPATWLEHGGCEVIRPRRCGFTSREVTGPVAIRSPSRSLRARSTL